MFKIAHIDPDAHTFRAEACDRLSQQLRFFHGYGAQDYAPNAERNETFDLAQ